MRADRLLSLLMLLQTRGKMSARALAEELAVTERTIYRDIEALEMAGVPVYAEPGRDGGYALVDRYRTSLTGLSGDEVRALFMLSIPAPLAELGVSQELKAALLKLTAALPATRRDDEEHVRNRFYLDAVGWENDSGPTPHLRTVHQAVWQDRRVVLKYRAFFSTEIEQCVEPYGLVVKAGAWYLVFAYAGRIRTRRLSELMDVRLTGEVFTRSPDFVLETFWKEWCAQRAEEHDQFCVRVRIAPEMCAWLSLYLGSQGRDALAHAGPPDAAGWFTLTLTFDYFETARSRLLPLGGAIEVLAPDELRLSMADFAEQILRIYRPS
ncbi:MAG: WYL domain-containing protein [Anaerolineae bacterium]|nr:WYL domain-containing protein [Anaerolineae bacterium]